MATAAKTDTTDTTDTSAASAPATSATPAPTSTPATETASSAAPASASEPVPKAAPHRFAVTVEKAMNAAVATSPTHAGAYNAVLLAIADLARALPLAIAAAEADNDVELHTGLECLNSVLTPAS